MTPSKSTDKLIALKDIITQTIKCLSKEKMDELIEIKIEWSEIKNDETGPLPNLYLKFMS